MSRVISKESVQRANDSLKKNATGNMSIGSNNISARFNTIVGTREMTISKSKVMDAARSVMKDSKR